MECPNEFTWAMFCDGELPETEIWMMRKHLAECDDCRQLSAALHEENRALVHALQHLDAAEVPLAFSPAATEGSATAARKRLVELAATAFGLGFGVRLAFDYMTGQEVPAAFAWLNPFHAEGQLNFLLTSFVYLLNQGGPNIMSLMGSFGILAIGAAILYAAPRLIRR